MKKILLTILIFFSLSFYAIAVEKRDLSEVSTDSFTGDTQITLAGSTDDHAAMGWWIPNEYWEAIFARDATINQQQKLAIMDALKGVSLFAVVQFDVTPLGSFEFYPKDEIEANMRLVATDVKGTQQQLQPLQQINSDLELVLSLLKPVLSNALGNLGESMHFFVLNDKSESLGRILDPYQKGQLDIEIKKRTGDKLYGTIETPLNALFIPRICPNGKEAHISWNYCPWTGTPLPE